MESAVIVGLGGITPLGNDLETITQNLKNGYSNITRFEDPAGKLKATSISLVDTEDYKSSRDTSRALYLNQTALACQAIDRALEDSGLTPEIFNNDRTALVAGRGNGMTSSFERMNNYATKKVSPFDILRSIGTSVSSQISALYDIQGPVITVNNACATGLRTIAEGMNLIALGKADRVVCVCAESIETTILSGYDAMKALYRGADLTYASSPFSKHRGGLTYSEGSACVILEREILAQERNETYVRCLDYSDYSDGATRARPTGHGARKCFRDIQQRLLERNLGLDVIGAHATSTPEGDRVEGNVIHEVFGDNVPVTPLKALTGHSMAASTIHEVLYMCLMSKHGFIPPTPVVDWDPDIPQLDVPDTLREQPVDVFVKAGFGFGGLNVVASFQRWQV